MRMEPPGRSEERGIVLPQSSGACGPPTTCRSGLLASVAIGKSTRYVGILDGSSRMLIHSQQKMAEIDSPPFTALQPEVLGG